MKTLMIFLPVTENWMAPPSTTILTGALESAGYESSNFDMNAEFYNFMSEPENLELFKNQYEELDKTLSENQQKFLEENPSNSLYLKSFSFQKSKLKENHYTIDMLIENMASARDYFRNSPEFYDMKMCIDRYIKTTVFLEKVFSFSLIYHQLISENSILKKFADLMVEKIVEYNPELIGESVTYDDQRVFIRILNMAIKEKINPHISVGGYFISQRSEGLSKADLERLCVDSFSYSGAGEASIIKLADYVAGKCQIEEVFGLVYLDENGELVRTDVSKATPKFYSPSFKGINKDLYFVPEPIFSVETTKGCYWHRCAFCFHVTDDTPIFEQKTVDDLFNQLKEIKEKYGVRNFEFVNHCIHPNFLRKFAQKLIDEKLDIRYMTFLRIEKEFDEELLSLLYKSGLRVVHWGVESGSNRILEFVDKGITAELSERVIRDAHKVGIVNHIFMMYAFPTETEEERQMSLNFMDRNREYIGSMKVLKLSIEKDSLFGKYPERYGFKLNSFQKTNGVGGNANSYTIPYLHEITFLSTYYKMFENELEKLTYFYFRGEGLLHAIKRAEERENL